MTFPKYSRKKLHTLSEASLEDKNRLASRLFEFMFGVWKVVAEGGAEVVLEKAKLEVKPVESERHRK